MSGVAQALWADTDATTRLYIVGALLFIVLAIVKIFYDFISWGIYGAQLGGIAYGLHTAVAFVGYDLGLYALALAVPILWLLHRFICAQCKRGWAAAKERITRSNPIELHED